MFLCGVACIFLQFYNTKFTSLISPFVLLSLALYFFTSVKVLKNISIIFFVGFLLMINLFFSVAQGNSSITAVRFFIALIGIAVAITVKPNKQILNLFIIACCIFSIALLVMEHYYIVHPGQWIIDRANWALNGLGDVYTYNNWFYRIQIKGNSLLPVALFVTMLENVRWKKLKCLILILGIIVAGNFMFWLSTALFIVYYIFFYGKSKFRKIAVSSLTIPAMAGIVVYLKDVFSYKSQNSLPIRMEQIRFLWHDFTHSYTTVLFGNGLGHVLTNAIGEFRDYSGATYFELQTFYIIDQLGLINFSLYVGSIFFLIGNNWKSRKQICILIFYLIYAVSNPYIFDVTNIVVFLIISSLSSDEYDPKAG